MTAPGRRLPRELQELYGHLTSESDVFRAQGLKMAIELPDIELRSLYEALIDRFMRIPGAELAESLIELAAVRNDLTQTLLTALGAVPPVSLDPAVPLRLGLKLPPAAIGATLAAWERQNEAPSLAAAAKTALKRLNKEAK
jgi:hypothetical protein